MSEQKERFTKVSGGKMYLSEEVDRYIEIVGSAYAEALEELEELKKQNIKDSDKFKQEQEKTIQTLAQERKTRQQEIAELNERLKSERISKDAAIAKANDIEKVKTDNTADIEKFNQLLAEAKESNGKLQDELNSEKEQKVLVQKQLEEKLAEQKISIQRELDKALEDNEKLQQEKEALKATLDNGSLGNANNYIDLLKRTSDMANEYVRDIEDKMNQLENEANTKADEQLNQAQAQATNIVDEAKTQSDKIVEEATNQASMMVKKAEAKRQELLTRTRTEYDGIRGLIEQASKEYANMATNAKEEDLEWDS
jgi:Alanyl-tRNA synthetase